MTIEYQLKELIISKYGNMISFSKSIGMPNSTLATILTKGVAKANIKNIIMISTALGISADELANGRIVFRETPLENRIELTAFFAKTKLDLMSYDRVTIGDYELTKKDRQTVIDMLEMSLDWINRDRMRSEP